MVQMTSQPEGTHFRRDRELPTPHPDTEFLKEVTPRSGEGPDGPLQDGGRPPAFPVFPAPIL